MWTNDLSGGSATGSVSWGALSDARFRVSPEKVLGAAAALIDESARFRAIVAARLEAMRADEPGGDPVSNLAAKTLNDRAWRAPDSFISRCLDYADMLDALADQMGEAARSYGHTEDAIAAVFTKRADDHFDRPDLVGRDAGYRPPAGSINEPRAV